MIYCSFYTKNTPYEQVIKTYLEPSLIRWNLRYGIRAEPDGGSWQVNTGMKSRIMLEMLEEKKEDIVFLDADAEILQFPELFGRIPEEYDIALHWLNWEKQYGKKNMPLELLSGTLFWRYNEKALNLLHTWIKTVKDNPTIWEQKCLHTALKKHPEIKVYDLPYSYCSIIDRWGKNPCDNPVIVHNQVSRTLRRRKK